MTKILVLYYSMYGHVEKMAHAIAEGANSVTNCHVTVKRVADLMSEEALSKVGANINGIIPIADPKELAEYDAIIFGTPTRFGNMCAQMRNFLDQTGGLWFNKALVGKVGSVFTSTGTGGGRETTISSFHTTLFHHGMVVVGMPYATPETFETEHFGGSPLGASTFAGADGKREVNEKELNMARYQGKHVAEIAAKLFK